jgi:predicted dehydrogenase/threonine dehydrogenase-like Zn-dependent dehydrogenase
MKQILQNFNTGDLAVYDVPAPLLRPGGVIVRTHYSLISSGTEGGTVRLAKQNLLNKARSRPDLVKKVLNVARTDGIFTAYEAVSSNLDSPLPLGYSLAGEVVEVGERVDDLKVGDLVACYGSMVANHAELNYVPRNMAVRIPDGVDLRHAAFCMLGAIAMNGVRRAQADLGSTVVVIGLGLLGQLATQLLRASGCHVFGVDVDERKLELARVSGAAHAKLRTDPHLEEAIAAFSNGLGVDAVIITAATDTPDPVELAGRVTRMRGRVVALGKVPYELPRDTYLFKEIDFVTALAFGPGVNDPNYETRGLDYPAAHVRWTGNRNIQAFVRLVQQGMLNPEPLITHEIAADDAEQAFALLTGERQEYNLGILLRYDTATPYHRRPFPTRPAAKPRPTGKVGISVIGAGSHAVSYVFDALAAQDVNLRGIVSAGGFKSQWYGDRYQFAFAASDPQDLLTDSATHAVVILSRHDTHASYTLQALEAGKDVFVEKPLCLTAGELERIVDAQQRTGGRLMVGYNRRYAALGQSLCQYVRGHAQPLSVTYRMNVGSRPKEHWLHDADTGGGLILGEAVHFIDFIQYLVHAQPTRVYAHSLHSATADILDHDNVMLSIQFANGSMGSLHYISTGDKSMGRERIEVFGDNALCVLEDWRSLVISKDGRRKKQSLLKQDKGFKAEIAEFVQSIAAGTDFATMPFDDVVAGMRTAFAALESLRTGNVIDLQQQADS